MFLKNSLENCQRDFFSQLPLREVGSSPYARKISSLLYGAVDCVINSGAGCPDDCSDTQQSNQQGVGVVITGTLVPITSHLLYVILLYEFSRKEHSAFLKLIIMSVFLRYFVMDRKKEL